MHLTRWQGIKWFARLFATPRPEPAQQAERVLAMQRHIVLPAKAVVMAVVLYYLYYSRWLVEVATTRGVVLETIQNFFVFYVLINAGVATAAGEIIAFTDDDCLPDPSWLERAHARLRDGALAGLEGAVVSDRDDAERYRIVSNTDFGGFGFMTANLFIRRDLLAQAGGFDERFEAPHFREDTDLAWRVLAHGPIPFAPEVRVVHPAHVRTLARESAAVRGRFFVHDALLFAKHPERYLKLLVAERHFEEL